MSLTVCIVLKSKKKKSKKAWNKYREIFEEEANEATDDDHPLMDNPPTNESYPLKT